MKNKDVEEIVLKALEEYSGKQDKWNHNIESITKEAFAAHRVHDFTEHQNKVLENHLKAKDKEIQEHQKAIDNLRGYISFLESRIQSLKNRFSEHDEEY